jgi:MFS family permease
MLEQLDSGPTSREHWKILFISGMGLFTDAYDRFVIGVVAIVFGRVADRLGRRKIYGFEVLVLAAGATLPEPKGQSLVDCGASPPLTEPSKSVGYCVWSQVFY